MRVGEKILAVVLCATALCSCGGSGAQHFTARPGEHLRVTRKPTSNGTLSDLASQVTMDTLLGHKGAKLLKAEPFKACPGEAGEQTFRLPASGGPALLHIGFTQWNGKTTIVSYQRPAGGSDDPQALEAMRRELCSNPL
jgi:hypothetical protein